MKTNKNQPILPAACVTGATAFAFCLVMNSEGTIFPVPHTGEFTGKHDGRVIQRLAGPFTGETREAARMEAEKHYPEAKDRAEAWKWNWAFYLAEPKEKEVEEIVYSRGKDDEKRRKVEKSQLAHVAKINLKQFNFFKPKVS